MKDSFTAVMVNRAREFMALDRERDRLTAELIKAARQYLELGTPENRNQFAQSLEEFECVVAQMKSDEAQLIARE
jgi:hypothetical protein